jgi:hypothetical protein
VPWCLRGERLGLNATCSPRRTRGQPSAYAGARRPGPGGQPRFLPSFLTRDEESSGIIDASSLSGEGVGVGGPGLKNAGLYSATVSENRYDQPTPGEATVSLSCYGQMNGA